VCSSSLPNGAFGPDQADSHWPRAAANGGRAGPTLATRARKGSFHPSRSSGQLPRFLVQKTSTPRWKSERKNNHLRLDSTAPRKYIHSPKSNRQGSQTHMVASFHTRRELYQIGVSVSKSDVNSGARHPAVGSLQQSLCHEFRLSWKPPALLCVSLRLAAVVPLRRRMATLLRHSLGIKTECRPRSLTPSGTTCAGIIIKDETPSCSLWSTPRVASAFVVDLTRTTQTLAFADGAATNSANLGRPVLTHIIDPCL
jgi:hypothetical protein